jgi:hypothetical protein
MRAARMANMALLKISRNAHFDPVIVGTWA